MGRPTAACLQYCSFLGFSFAKPYQWSHTASNSPPHAPRTSQDAGPAMCLYIHVHVLVVSRRPILRRVLFYPAAIEKVSAVVMMVAKLGFRCW
jgi:hypothetical protein